MICKKIWLLRENLNEYCIDGKTQSHDLKMYGACFIDF